MTEWNRFHATGALEDLKRLEIAYLELGEAPREGRGPLPSWVIDARLEGRDIVIGPSGYHRIMRGEHPNTGAKLPSSFYGFVRDGGRWHSVEAPSEVMAKSARVDCKTLPSRRGWKEISETLGSINADDTQIEICPACLDACERAQAAQQTMIENELARGRAEYDEKFGPFVPMTEREFNPEKWHAERGLM